MSRFALTLARFCLCAWPGAAAMFVVIGIREVTHPHFESIVRNHLALLRFPCYYAFGFTLLGLGWLGLLASRRSDEISNARWWASMLLVTAALLLMAYDHQFIYRPLAAMISPPDAARPAEFIRYHRASEAINTLQVGLVIAAAWVSALPRARREREAPRNLDSDA